MEENIFLSDLESNIYKYKFVKDCFFVHQLDFIPFLGKQIKDIVTEENVIATDVQVLFSYFNRLSDTGKSFLAQADMALLFTSLLHELVQIRIVLSNMDDVEHKLLHEIAGRKISEVIKMQKDMFPPLIREKVSRGEKQLTEGLDENFCQLLKDYFTSDLSSKALKTIKDRILHDNKILVSSASYIHLLKYYASKYDKNISGIVSLFLIDRETLSNRYGFSMIFPNDVMSEIYSHNSNKGVYREDLRDIPFYTIDGPNAAEIDDAIGLDYLTDGSADLYIAISDVPAFINYDSNTVINASKQGETFYLFDRIKPMLPDYIAKYLCSLIENNVRHTITFKINSRDLFSNKSIDKKLTIIPSKIMVREKLTYDGANNIIISDKDDKVARDLRFFSDISQNLRVGNTARETYRREQNADNLRLMNMMNYDNESRYDLLSSNIIHEMMVLINSLSAELFAYNDIPYIYRAHNYFITDSDGTESEVIDNTARAFYSDVPRMHMGLGLEKYSHSSAPLRRYVDMINQYLTHLFIFDDNVEGFNKKDASIKIQEISVKINEMREKSLLFQNEYNYYAVNRLIKRR